MKFLLLLTGLLIIPTSGVNDINGLIRLVKKIHLTLENKCNEVTSLTSTKFGTSNVNEKETTALKQQISQIENQLDKLRTDNEVAIAKLQQEVIILKHKNSIKDAVTAKQHLWRFSNYTVRKNDDSIGKSFIKDEPFFVGGDDFGYKVRMMVFLQGDGSGRGTHLSVFFQIMKGPYDNVLRWPFEGTVTISILSQRPGESSSSQTTQVTKEDDTSFSQTFSKPGSKGPTPGNWDPNNVPYGFQKHTSHDVLERPPYLVNDEIFIKTDFIDVKATD